MHTFKVLLLSSALLMFLSAQSPGDIIDCTYCDLQAIGSYGQRIDVDDYRQAHIVWMQPAYIMWCIRWADIGYSYPVQVAVGSHPQMDITRDVDPAMQRTVIVYHYNPGAGYYSWVDIDGGNGWGTWPNTPRSPCVPDHIWPYIAVANNNNFILATGDYGGNNHHVYLTSDEGISWSYFAEFDSCSVLSQLVRASEKRDNNRVAFVHTQFITDTIANGQLDQDVYYMISDDGGITWGPQTNLTNYHPDDTVRAYCNVNSLFDDNDHLHIAWAGRRVTDNYHDASKIFHWDEFNDTITVVNSPSTYYNDPGAWWITVPEGGDFGAWRMPADQPQLVFDTVTSYLYCLWHGNDDYNDFAADGFINGELYGAYSTDHGITWSDYVNLTNTRTPGASAGECNDEDYMTACPKVVTDSIFITYIEDKDAGAYVQNEGVQTENPVRCWVFWTGLIRTGVEEERSFIPQFHGPGLSISPNPFVKSVVIDFSIGQSAKSIGQGAEGLELKVYDATGREVKIITQLHDYPITWSGDDQYGHRLPPGIYFMALNIGDIKILKKVIKLK
jgi:hypothetical protein